MATISQTISEGITFIEKGDYSKALDVFQALYSKNPENPDVLYNYGILLNELMIFDDSLRILQKLVKIDPGYRNAKVALAFTLLHLNKSAEAERLLEEAQITDPDNTFLLRNLGTIYAKKEEFEKALELFRRAEQIEPDSRVILYGIALALFKQDKMIEASEYLQKIIDQDIDDTFDQLSKDLQREIAQKSFSQNGLRMDAVFYCLSALEKYDEMSFTQIQSVTFEISMLGRNGLDPSDSKTTYPLSSIPGEFTALQLICYMYVGFKILKPEIDIGFDLSKEYAAAKEMLQH